MVRKLALAGALLAVLAAPALILLRSSGTAATGGPRAVRVSEDPCAACLMLASDPHFAAQRVLGPEDVKIYDDTGCLLRELPADRAGDIYFADATTGEWIPGAVVRFEPTTRPTPMGFGLAAGRAGSLDLEAAIRRVQSAAKEKN